MQTAAAWDTGTPGILAHVDPRGSTPGCYRGVGHHPGAQSSLQTTGTTWTVPELLFTGSCWYEDTLGPCWTPAILTPRQIRDASS